MQIYKQAQAWLHATFPAITAGIFDGLVALTGAISIAGALFSGVYEEHLFFGMSMILINVIVCSCLMAFISPIKASIQEIQEGPMILLSLLGVQIGATVYGSASFATFYALILVSTFASALAFMAVGLFRLSNFVRFIPINVIAGFLAGTGCLLIWGGLSFTLSDWHELTLFEILFSKSLLYWLPSALIGLAMFYVENLKLNIPKILQSFLFLLPIVLATVLFYVVAYFSETNIDQLREMKFLLEPFPKHSFFHLHPLSQLAEVRPEFIYESLDDILSIAVVSAIILLININSYELDTEQEANFNTELFSSGLSNLLSIPFGGAGITFHSLSLSVLTYKMQAYNRWVNVISALTMLCIVTFGSGLIALVPKLALAAIIFYMGIAFIYKWLIKAFFSFTLSEALATLGIVFVFLYYGVVSGVVFGSLVSLGLFIARYSRLSSIKKVFDISVFPSSVERSSCEKQILLNYKYKPLILFLKGYIFFANSHKIELKAKHILDKSHPKGLIFDFTGVVGLDSTSVSSFIKISRLCKKKGVAIFFSHLHANVKEYFLSQAPLFGSELDIQFTPRLDSAVELLEEEIIAAAKIIDPSIDQLSNIFNDLDFIRLRPEFSVYFNEMHFKVGQRICEEGESHVSMYLLQTGSVGIYKAERINRLREGSIFGDISFFLEVPCTAKVVALEDCSLLKMNQEQYRRLTQEHPEVSRKLVAYIMRENMARLIQANRHIENLLKLMPGLS